MSDQQQDYSPLEEQALLISTEIFNSISQYTHDSNIAKFFLTDELAKVCYGLSGGFSSVIYNPSLDPDETTDKAILSFLYTLMTYGFNIYLKERSLKTNAAPYLLPTDLRYIKRIQKKTMKHIAEGELISTPLADKIIEILMRNIYTQMNLQEFTITRHRFLKKKFWDYTKLSLYWGYNFAKELLEGKEKRTKHRKRK